VSTALLPAVERKYNYNAARQVFQCSACRTQTTVKAGTILHKSRTALTKWFLAIYLLTQSKNDIAALELSRQLGVKWDTAWLIKQKLMEAMRQRNHIYKLAGCRALEVFRKFRDQKVGLCHLP
jgi:transposase-like protein